MPSSKEYWKDFILYKKNILILDFLILKKWIIYLQRFDGLNQIVIRNLDNDKDHTIHFDEKAYELDLSDQYEFDTDWIRFSFSSPITPKSIYDYNCKTKERVLKKTQETTIVYEDIWNRIWLQDTKDTLKSCFLCGSEENLESHHVKSIKKIREKLKVDKNKYKLYNWKYLQENPKTYFELLKLYE